MSASLNYCRMLLNTMLNDDANRTGTVQSPVCECGNERETVNTFYLDVHCTVKAGSACWTR